MISDRAEFTANIGMVSIQDENHTVDGSAPTEIVIRGASSGTFIKSVTVKSTVVVTRGMIRLYVYDGSSVTVLIAEIEVPPTNTSSGIDYSFSETVDLNYYLASGYELKASTYNAESFQVIADALDWAN